MTDTLDRLKPPAPTTTPSSGRSVLGGSTQPVNLKNKRQVALNAL